MPINGLDSILASPILAGSTVQESAIGRAWLRKHAADYDSVEFNVRVGKGVGLPPGTPKYVSLAAYASTTKRIDIVAHRGSSVDVIELKEVLGLGAIGQLIGYAHLYLADHPATGHVGMIGAGLMLQADVAPVYARSGIVVELFPEVQLASVG